jgi:RNA polymerase sigma factor
MAQEIEKWERILEKFGFDLEQLADETPKHIDTRNNAIDLSENISQEKDLVDKMYEKYRLPITMIVLRFQITKKVVKHSKKFIIATVVVFTKNLELIRKWMYKDRKGSSSC